MTGRTHDEHYRRLLVAPLQRNKINGMGADMIRLANEQVDTWPMHRPIDLGAHAKKLVRTFAIGLLFGDDRSHGYPIADMINRWTDHVWSLKVACPVAMPGTPRHRMLRDAEKLESCIIEWAERKRGQIDNRDLAIHRCQQS
jgi:cytochrome P450